MRSLNPSVSPQARQAVRAIMGCLETGRPREKALERMSPLHAATDGQRALSGKVVADYSGQDKVDEVPAFVAGLDMYFVLLCHLLSAAALSPDRGGFLDDLRNMTTSSFAGRMTDVISGRFHADHGVDAFLTTLDASWLCGDAVRQIALPLKQVIAALAKEIEDGQFDIRDPLQRLHRAVFPVELSHATGQFYSPPWLAELVLTSTGWRPGESLIDPFCGSGVFMVTALHLAVSQGQDFHEVARSLSGIDMSRTACCAARTNILLAGARYGRSKLEGLPINIMCADSLAPAIDRRRADASADVARADVLVTNPPWVGWEYIPRSYREKLTPAWQVYSLFEQRGMKAAFLKEDLSTLCVPVALDLYLRDGGRAGLILRQSTMKSDLAGRGVRRLSIYRDREPLELTHIHDLGNLRVFDGAVAPAAIWLLNKGAKTSFPVPVSSWSSLSGRVIDVDSTLDEVSRTTRITPEFCRPLAAEDPEGRWSFDLGGGVDPNDAIKGSNDFKPRIGFFTGGANAVYYLDPVEPRGNGMVRYRNIVERAKREAPQVTVELEPELIYPVVRGRDVGFWNVRTVVFVLSPHTPETRIRPVPEEAMRTNFPKCFRYLRSMRTLLDQRRGFSGWEKKAQKENFYAIQRIGAYSFSPYKVCWSYISDDFVVGVCGSGEAGKPILPNDKVVFLPAATRTEAYFLAGILSFNVIRASVISSVSGRQISGNVIRAYALPSYDPGEERHSEIAAICEKGHQAMAAQDLAGAVALYELLNRACAELFGLPVGAIEMAAQRISAKLGFYPFKPVRRRSGRPPSSKRQAEIGIEKTPAE